MSYKLPRHALSNYTRCPRKYYYRFKKGLVLKKQPDYIVIGEKFHAGMASFFCSWIRFLETAGSEFTDSDAQNAFWNGINETPGSPETGNLAFDMLWYWWTTTAKEELAEIEEILAIEETFYIDVDGYLVPWTPDLIVRKRNGALAVIDHKTVGNIKDAFAFLSVDEQIRRYALGAYDKYGEVPEMTYSLHKRDLPPSFTSPEGDTPYLLTATGRKSTRSNDAEDYIKRVPMIFTPKQIEATRREMLHQILELEYTEDRGVYTRRYIKGGSYGCTNCEYFEPCKREYDGNDMGMTSVLYDREVVE